MQYTSKLKLKKPDYTDMADIADINENMDILDGHTHTLDEIGIAKSSFITMCEYKDIAVNGVISISSKEDLTEGNTFLAEIPDLEYNDGLCITVMIDDMSGTVDSYKLENSAGNQITKIIKSTYLFEVGDNENVVVKGTFISLPAKNNQVINADGTYSDLPESIKNPSALTVKVGETTTTTYDGSYAKTINIDNVPASGSNNPVTSGGVYDALSIATYSGSANLYLDDVYYDYLNISDTNIDSTQIHGRLFLLKVSLQNIESGSVSDLGNTLVRIEVNNSLNVAANSKGENLKMSDITTDMYYMRTAYLLCYLDSSTLTVNVINAFEDNVNSSVADIAELAQNAYESSVSATNAATEAKAAAETFATDATLSTEGKAADAKAAGERIKSVENLFVKEVTNIFNGYRHDFAMDSTYRVTWNDVTPRTGVIVNVKPSTTYTVVKEPTEKESQYYYYRLATFKDHEQGLAYRIDNGVSGSFNITAFQSEDSVKYLESGTDTTVYTFTTGANDDTLVLIAAENIEPRIQILEGEYTSFQNDKLNPNSEELNIYSVNETDKLVSTSINSALPAYDRENNLIRIKCNGAGVFEVWKKNRSGNFTYYYISNVENEETNYSGIKINRIGIRDSNNEWKYLLYNGIECEGAVKEKGAADFVCGFHGDEIQTEAELIIDGVAYGTDEVFDMYAEKIEFITLSDVYHCNSSDIAFERTKRITWTGDKMYLYNNFYVKSDFYVETAALCMLVVLRTSYNDSLTGYSTNKDFKINPIPEPPDKDTRIGEDECIDESALYGTNGLFISAKIMRGSRSKSTGYVADFINRLKLYNHIMTDTQLHEGDRLWCEAEYTVKM